MVNFAMFALLTTTIVYFSEITDLYFRSLGPNFFLIFWSLGQITLSIVMKFITSWKFLTIGMMGVPMFICAFFYKFMRDSPRLLVVQEKYLEAKDAIRNLAKINKRTVPLFNFEGESKLNLFGNFAGYEIGKRTINEVRKQNKVKTIATLFAYKSIRYSAYILLLFRIVMTIANHGSVLALNTFNDNVS
mmetsp:Transcript_35597/g.32069  ORF Transcript_35597/g.32069 Transcript_35597/m.32069 type:complete len:189 (-) Transcript_35597:616-1182(-)